MITNIMDELRRWANLSGHEKCWHHPEILTRLCDLAGIPINEKPKLPPREEFDKGCKCYQDHLYGPAKDVVEERCRKARELGEF